MGGTKQNSGGESHNRYERHYYLADAGGSTCDEDHFSSHILFQEECKEALGNPEEVNGGQAEHKEAESNRWDEQIQHTLKHLHITHFLPLSLSLSKEHQLKRKQKQRID